MISLPYIPTWILSPTPGDDIVYIYQSTGTSSRNFELLALNTTLTFDATTIPLDTISPSLSFINDSQNEVIIPTIDGQGNMLIYTGYCTKGSQQAALWQFKPSTRAPNGNGTWQELHLSTSSSEESTNLDGPKHLASAFAFSGMINATADIFVFGGMCPNVTDPTSSEWLQTADYSNSMLRMEPSQSSLSSAASYDLSISSSRGPPIAEAGFTITPLAPTFFQSSSNQMQAVNQNFVVIGGHTQQAFINMSQVALFSLPEQSWSFVSVDAPTGQPPTDLAARFLTSIDTRSGHTATLTPDGKKVIVFGGWVGDVTTPANPQLAVLELGQGYGGSGDWQWVVPTATGSGLAPGAGLFGHGAAMIAGDVMLVIGGYQITTSGASKQKRATPSSNTINYLFNVTSSSFISSYTNPATSNMEAKITADSVLWTNERVGLAVGLTLGILALIILVIFYFWYSHRLRLRRDARDEDLRKLAAGAQRLQLPGQDYNRACYQPEMTQLDLARERDRAAHDPYSWNVGNSTASTIRSVDRDGPEAARTGLLLEIPSPTRGLRRSLHSRGTYQPAPRYDDGRRGLVSTIHPIDERDEYDDEAVDDDNAPGDDTIHRRDYRLLKNVPVLDPFRDSADSRTPSPQSPGEREAEIRGWVDDWNEADAIINSGGRLSPEKTDRTSSTLSDMSARSMQSYSSIQRSAGGLSRSVSQRSGGLFSSIPLRSTNNKTPQDDLVGRSNSSQHDRGHGRSRSLTSNPGKQDDVSNVDVTGIVETSVPQSHEDDALLGEYGNSGESSPTKIGRRAKGWMGSMRRVFTGTDRSSSKSPEREVTSSSSPSKSNFSETGLPRRAASTGGMLWQKRQGAKDWETGGSRFVDESAQAQKSKGDEDWDVESAVERRVVQVMFTVPKEKLRVVNKGSDSDGESVMSSKYEDAIEGDGVVALDTGKGKDKE